MRTFTTRVTEIRRAGHSTNGNPRWKLTTQTGDYLTVPDASLGYAISNPEHLGGRLPADVQLELDARGRILDARPVVDDTEATISKGRP